MSNPTMIWIRADALGAIPKGTKADVWCQDGDLSYRIADCAFLDWCGELTWLTTGDRGGGRKVENSSRKITHLLFLSSPDGAKNGV